MLRMEAGRREVCYNTQVSRPTKREKLITCKGALLNSVPKDDSPDSLDFMGSTLVCVAKSVEEVREQLSKDIYATSGVWDMDKVRTPSKQLATYPY